MTKTAFQKTIEKRTREAMAIEPNDLGIPWLTVLYRKINTYFKRIPFLFVVPFAFVFALLVFLIFGVLAVRLVSFLQYGF
jgi:hypothetical protein